MHHKFLLVTVIDQQAGAMVTMSGSQSTVDATIHVLTREAL
jgi:hypothetical protein